MHGPHTGNGSAGAVRAADDLLDRSNLSTSQYLLWLGQRLHPDSPLYNMALAFDIAGPLDAARFERAFASLAARSDALRTVIEEIDGVPRQRARSRLPAVEHVDLTGAAEPAHALRAFLAERAARPFDLRESLVDTALIRVAEDRHVWFLDQHHLITDAWATALVYRHVAELYAGTADETAPLPQYAAWVEHERALRAAPRFDRARAYWQRAIEDPAGPVRLYGRDGAGAGTRTERLTVPLGIARSRRILALAADLGAGTLTGAAARFDVFATALFAYLHRVSGQERLAIGTPSHNRASSTLKETIGALLEIFPVTGDVAEDDTFRSLFGRVRSASQQFLRHAQPGASSAALMRGFNVVLNYIHATFPPFAGMPMRSEWVHAGHGDSRHHLRLQVHDFDASGSFVVHFDFNRDLFDASTRAAAGRHFLRVLDALLGDPDGRIRDVDLLGGDARQSVEAPADSVSPGADDETIVAMVAAQAVRTPDAVAVSCGGRDVTYAELLGRANALASRLRNRDVTAESRVGIHLERSADAVIGVLGVLMAGGAYVPLAPEDPPERMRFMLRDAGVRLCVTSSALEARLADLDGEVVRIEEVDGVRGGTAAGPAPGDAAYVLYTSGSTGQPKGVVVEHGSLARYIAWARDFYLRGRALDFPLFTSLSFDLTVTSLFLPLVSGGRVVVYGGDGGGASALLRVLDEDRVDAIKLTPAHLSLLADGDRRASRIGMLIVGGEDLKGAQVRRALAALGDIEIWNEYGPTEATVGCMIHRFDPARDTGASVPIGRAAGAARIHLLDAALRPVPAGVTGEIFVAGPGVARGYLNRPALTAERFLPDPRQAGGRMYRTGDLGRWRTDGVMEFLGRADGQVKVRGARIEPAEVESALLAHPAIDACAVGVEEMASARPVAAAVHCARCGLPSTYPGARFDGDGVCHLCLGFAGYRERVRRYFRSMEDLRTLIEDTRARGTADHDCVMLLSGGKDSTYALCRLVEMGVRVLAFTLDNGYLSDGAKANIRRVTASLGVEHIFGTTPAMNAIFVDSLKRHANVCNGCFKTVYTLGARLARERAIPTVVTGLSRGQFFETRLTEELFRDDAIDADHIDRVILEARKAYHRSDDAVARLLDTRDFHDDALFEDVRFVDFYRYCDVDLDEMLRYLAEHVPWIRPEDTGRSTNCLINDVGIFVHRRERGFHNYAFPYSWDVRIGHKTRVAALHELTDEPDPRDVRRILAEIGYDDAPAAAAPGEVRLVAYYASREPLGANELRAHLARNLPAWMLPSRFVRVDALPLTPHGKVDRAALRTLHGQPAAPAAEHVAPRTILEERIAGIWADVLGTARIGVLDAFLELGGNSLAAIRIISRVNDAFAIELPLQSAFEASTVAALAELVERELLRDIDALSDDEAERLAAGLDPALPDRR